MKKKTYIHPVEKLRLIEDILGHPEVNTLFKSKDNLKQYS